VFEKAASLTLLRNSLTPFQSLFFRNSAVHVTIGHNLPEILRKGSPFFKFTITCFSSSEPQFNIHISANSPLREI
jgi:hypothetical protein